MTEERRLEAVRRRLTPELRAEILRRMASGELPRPLLAGLSAGAVEAAGVDRAPLEAMLRVPALEAIVQRVGRPPLLVRDDAVVIEPLPDFPPDIESTIREVQHRTASVGRVEFLNAGDPWGGTGWVIGERGGAAIVATNRHVAQIVARRFPDGRIAFRRGPTGIRYGAQVDFGEEVDSRANDTARTAPVIAIDYLAEDLAADVALLRIRTDGFALPAPIPLAAAPAGIGDLVALIGYPAFDTRNDEADQAFYFRDLYEVKRFSPGFVTQALTADTVLSHDCTSLGGSSGSPLIDLATGAAVGLHFAGEYGIANSAVGAETLKALLAGAETRVAVPAGQIVEARDGQHPADFFAGREGFATEFLHDGDVATPWPSLSPALAAGLAAPSDDPPEPNELRYMHFGVKYSGEHRLPLITAVNIDGAESVRVKRGDDKWYSDGRIDRAVQLDAGNFADGEIDRGHMVRREDPNWGDDAETANFDTFHYVNAAPQHSRLNQGKALWQGLENYILDSARTGGFRVCVFTGPILGEDDPEIDGARVPLEYWKVVATLDAAGEALRATAYLLSQGQLIRDLLEKRRRTEAMEGVVLGPYRTFQIAIADLAEGTGYDFGPYAAADPLGGGREEARAAAEPRFVPLETLDDIVL